MGKITAKQRILETTKNLFYKQGYNTTGVNQIIDEAGVAKSTLFHHFPTKEALCRSYLQETSDAHMVHLEQLLAGKGSVQGKIVELYENLRKDVVNNDYTGCHFHNLVSEISSRDEALFSIVQAHKEKLRRLFHGLFAGSASNDFADFAFLLFEGTLIQCQIQQQQWPIDNAMRVMKKLIEQQHGK